MTSSTQKKIMIRVCNKGTITIPKKLRNELGIEIDDFLEAVILGKGIFLTKVKVAGDANDPKVDIYEKIKSLQEEIL